MNEIFSYENQIVCNSVYGIFILHYLSYMTYKKMFEYACQCYKRQSSLTQIALICNNAAYRIENK